MRVSSCGRLVGAAAGEPWASGRRERDERRSALRLLRLEVAQQPVKRHPLRVVVLPIGEVGDEIFPHFPPHVFAGISLRGRMSGGPWLTDKTQSAAVSTRILTDQP
jgi:hypothetical protein